MQVFPEDKERYYARKMTLQRINLIRVHMEGFHEIQVCWLHLKTMASIKKKLNHLWHYFVE